MQIFPVKVFLNICNPVTHTALVKTNGTYIMLRLTFFDVFYKKIKDIAQRQCPLFEK